MSENKYERRYARVKNYMGKRDFIIESLRVNKLGVEIPRVSHITVTSKNDAQPRIRCPYDNDDPREKVWAAIIASRGAVHSAEIDREIEEIKKEDDYNICHQ